MKKIRVYALSAATAAVLTATALAADTGTAFPENAKGTAPAAAHAVMNKDAVGYSGAVNLFKQYYGAAVKIKSVSYDGKHHPYYEVEGYTQDAEKEMKISAETGEVISIKTDAPDKDREKKSIDTDGILPPQLVTAAALKKAGPAYQIAEWEVEASKDGHTYYEVKMFDDGGNEMKVVIEAVTGTIVPTT
mgnify:FL=1